MPLHFVPTPHPFKATKENKNKAKKKTSVLSVIAQEIVIQEPC